MINIIQNTVSALKSSLGIIRKGLELFLPFAKSEIIGSDLVVNGDFDTDSDWSKASGVAISGGAAYLPNGGAWVSQVIGTEVGRLYRYTLVAKSTAGAGALEIISDAVVKEIPSAVGSIPSVYTTYTGTFVAGDDTIKLRESLDGEIYIDSIYIEEVSQFAPDKSTNTNDAKLFTGKALSFDGINDYVDADYSSSTRTIAFWIKPRGSGTSEGIMYLGYSGGQMGIKFGNSIISTSVLTGVTTYVNNVNTASITLDVWQRVVITTDLFTPTVLRLGYTYLNAYGDYSITDLQFYDTAWTAADVTYDYNNPQHLVTDNSASSIALSNLKGFWHLSDGDGAIAYDSSGEGNDGTINGATWETALATIPQLGMMDWAKSTVGSDEITLIQAPNNIGYDILGNALRLRENGFNLDGSGYAKVANDDSLDITTTITLEAWVKLEPFKTGILDHIIGKRIGGSWCRLYRPSANVLRMEIAAGGNLDIDVVDGEWCHIVGTINGTSGKLYYNSGAPEETVYGSTFTWDLDIPVGVGAWFNTSSTVSVTSKTIGIIDETRIYNRALSASEIEQNFKAGKNKHKN